ncbi:cadherin-like domain-containing protein, partial [Chromatium okenii]|uniref:cadherin-like domain-containing protein n=1 Tax=Chromatium okenii TaxID=61644 RepID=UPI0026ED3A31
SSASARAWAAGSNDVVDATHRAYWTPATKESGLLDAFTVVAKDTHGAKSDTPCQVQVQVTPINHLPQGTDVTLTTDEDVSLQLSAADFGFNDIDEDDILNEVQITALETAGAISKADIDAGKLVFIPEQDANGDNYATLAFKVNDGKAWSSANNTLTINVTVVNDVPITTNKNPTATDAVLTAEAKTPLIFTADQFGFSDEDADDVLVNIQITTLSSAGDLQYNGAAVELDQIISKADIDAGKLVFTATTALKTTIGFKVSDGKAWSTAPNALNIDVTAALNTAPTITGIPAEPQKVTASKPTDLADVTVADDDRDSLTVTLTPSNGKMGGLTDADTKIAGIQLIGTAADINDALIAATFTAIKDGTASIGFSVTDSKETTTATYELIVDSSPTPPTTNHAPTIKGIPTAPQTVTVSEAADLADV